MPRRKFQRKRGGKRRVGIRYKGGNRKVSGMYSAPVHIKRIGQLCRIGNDPAGSGGNPVATATGNGSLAVGTSAVDTMNTRQVGAAMTFALQCATDYGDFVNLFDRYKLKGVKLQFLYQSNLANSDSTTGTNALPLLSYSFDADDATVPTSIDEVQKKQYCHQKILNGNSMFSVYLKPRLLKEVYASAISSGYNSAKATWLDSANVGVPHYGLKMWLNNWGPGNTKFHQLTITPTYYFSLKDTQ